MRGGYTEMPSTEEVRSFVSNALQTGHPELAAPWRDELLGNGNDAANLVLLGHLSIADNDVATALAYFGEAIRLEPFYVDAHIQRGNLFTRIGAFALALDSFERVLLFVPFHDEALGALVHAAQRAGRLNDAVYALHRRVRLGGETDEVQNTLGICLHGVHDLDGALAAYMRASELSPQTALYYSNAATIYYHLERYDDALTSLDRALEIDPQLKVAWYHTGNLLKASRRIAEAEIAYRRALAIAPDYAEAHFALGCTLLHQDKWSEGWSEYEWRWRVPGLVTPIHAGVPLWLGERLAGRRIMVVAEQGSGDTFQYIRYAGELSALGAEVVLWAPPENVAILRRLPFVTHVASNRFELPRCDYFIPAMSLPRLLNSSVEQLSTTPYLTCDPELREAFSRELGPRRKALRIGLAWAGNSMQVENFHRSTSLEHLVPLLRTPGVRWISLQKGPERQQIPASGLPVEDWSEKLTTYNDTAALMCALDGIVSVCSSPIHLAGALGVRSVAMLAWAADWRWREDDHATPYYGNIEIVKMQSLNAWADVAERTAQVVSSWKPKASSRKP